MARFVEVLGARLPKGKCWINPESVLYVRETDEEERADADPPPLSVIIFNRSTYNAARKSNDNLSIICYVDALTVVNQLMSG